MSKLRSSLGAGKEQLRSWLEYEYTVGFKKLGYRDTLIYALLRILLPQGLNVFNVYCHCF